MPKMLYSSTANVLMPSAPVVHKGVEERGSKTQQREGREAVVHNNKLQVEAASDGFERQAVASINTWPHAVAHHNTPPTTHPAHTPWALSKVP